MTIPDSFKKLFGKSLSTGEELKSLTNRSWFDTGSYVVNKIINSKGRGVPSGHLLEFFGSPGSGKTMLALHILKSCQEQDGMAILIDVEGSFDADFATQVGVDLENLFIFKPTMEKKEKGGGVDEFFPLTYEDVFNRIEQVLIEVRKLHGPDFPCCIVWDSLGATNTNKDLGISSTKAGGSPIADRGLKAKTLRQWLTRIRPRVNASNTLLLVLNHVIANIPSNPMMHVAKHEISPGGGAPKFHSQVRLRFTKTGAKSSKLLDSNNKIIGEKLHIEVEKNRVGPPYRKASIDFFFEKDGGVKLDYYSGYMEYLIQEGVVDTKTSGWVKYTGENGEEKKYRKKDIHKLIEDFPELLDI